MANDPNTTTLCAADFDAFQAALDTPPAPTPRLIETMASYKAKIASGEIVIADDDVENIFVENDSVD